MSIAIPRLRFVLISSVTLLTLLVTSVVSGLFIVKYKDEAMTHFYHYAQTVAANVASAETDYIITENYASLQDSLVSFLQAAHVESIAVATPFGTIIADTQPEHLGKSITVSTKRTQLSDHENIQFVFKTSLAKTLFPIQIGDKLIGWCIIRFDINYIKENIYILQKNTIIVSGVAILFISTVFFFFSAAITHPLEEMMRAVSYVAGGDFSQKVKIAGVFELRKLAEGFNSMTLAIKKRETRLRQVQKMEAIGVLSSSIAHEFGNPLIGIKLFLSDLKKSSKLSQEDQPLLDQCLEECNRMNKLLRDLKYFYQPSSEEKRPVKLHQLLDNILLFLNSYLKELNIEVVREYGKNIHEVMIVEDQIKQVFINIIFNAAESMANNSGLLTISTDKKNDTVIVAIQDTGTGIKIENQKDIFMPFYSTKPDVTGSGLGLSVSYGIVKSHQGNIRVSSTPGQGTIFFITLPIG